MIDLFAHLLRDAPLSWAIVRTKECELVRSEKFVKPILEIGCGDGMLAREIFPRCKNAIDLGIDVDPDELARAVKTGIYRNVRILDITRCDLKSETFATVFANGVLEHIPNLDKALAEISRVLQAGGKLITTSPTDNYPRLLFYYRICIWLHLKPLAIWYGQKINRIFSHLHLYNHALWQQKLAAHGLRMTKYYYYNNELVILLHDIFLPFSLLTKTLKKVTNQMVLLPEIRKLLLSPLARYLTPSVLKSTGLYENNGSLLMIATKK